MTSDNLFSIGEIAKVIGITRKTILNYEAKGLIAPDKKEGSLGNRYYSIDTFTQIRTIRILQDIGLSLNEIKDYFSNTADLPLMIRRFEDLREKLDLAIEKLHERIDRKNEEIKMITIAPQKIYRRTYNSTSLTQKANILRDTALAAMKMHGTDTTNCMYFTEFYAEDPESTSYCIAVPADSEGTYVYDMPALRGISIFHHGAYEEIPKTRGKLITYAEENGIILSGTFRNVFLEGPPQHKDKERFVTQIIAIIE